MPRNNIRRKAQLGLDIREGGIAIPIAPNMYYMNGRSHDEGGIGIGPNNKNGLEVEGGEVVKVGDNDIKVFSSVPLLRGVSPAQLVMGGANPNKVFKAQEDFKDKNRINDDGTRYQTGGQKIYTPNESIQRQIQETGRITIGGAPTIGGLRTYGYLRGLSNVRKYGQNVNNLFTKSYNFLNKKLQNLINKNKISVDTAQKYNSAYREFVGENGQNLPKTISLMQDDDIKKAGGIYIKPSKRGTFTAAAKKRGMGVQEFASKVLANKEDYSPAMVKKANFARNASRWKKEYGGDGNVLPEVVVTPRSGYDKIYDVSGIIKRKKIAKDILQILPFSGFYSDVIDAITPNGISEPLSTGGAASSASAYGLAKAKVPFYSIPSLAFKTAMGLPDMVNDIYTLYNDIKIPKEEFNRNKKELGGNMIYTINGNIKNGLMSARPKAQTGTVRKIGSLYYVQDKTGRWIVAENQRSAKDRSADASNGYTRLTINHPNNNYKYNPLTGERLSESNIVETFKPIVVSSTARKGKAKLKSSKSVIQSQPTLQDTVNQITRDAIYRSNTPKIDLSKVTMPTFDVSQLGNKERRTYKANTPKSGRWIGQYKSTNIGDWIGLGSNVAASIASYLLTKRGIDKMIDPIKPVMAQAAKLKTRYNIDAPLSEISQGTQLLRALIRRNTQSSNTSLAREQRAMNEAQESRNRLYGQKENIETQLINQDRLNRQTVTAQNVATYNDYLTRLYAGRVSQNEAKISNINNLISGLTGSVNNILGTIEGRRATNNTLRAIAAANPNVDARLIGGFDYYIDPVTKRKYNKNQQYIGTINV